MTPAPKEVPQEARHRHRSAGHRDRSRADPVVTGPAEEITKNGIFVVGQDIKAREWKTDGKIKESSYAG